MKPAINFRHLVTALTFVLGLILLTYKSKEQNRSTNPNKKPSSEGNNIKVSTTDYIFFESLSKYLFVSLK